ncbi:PREDICTED: putative uncharacterized protein DDB_G0286901 [Acromyrmex echinatior]|uniref:putative uncharacterized protein DDB_G0286901 n=1 Tax=Acromyrmex echinatior TaxID=103372 RepID=UPI000580E2EB|nr:PREDICTED: putative uncharacterized protein DDB_G0286901 [Acromyrmex echinatior]
MPGIHIRTLSQFDWLDQEKESLLTVPGAYWLCHKKNIYKFIFRYHRTMKNTIQFSYGRELLKIIRKIIKCHPTQGQQFGTQHLLVTYNCTSWTRQDKMFAIMKFQQRTNAAAFSHAFVLTIRTFPSLEHSLFDLKYPIVKEADAGTTFKDLNISLDTEEKIISNVISTIDKESPRKDTTCHTKEIHAKYAIEDMMLSKALETKINSFQDDTMESASLRENLDKRIENATITAQMHFVDKHNKEFHNDVQENKYINCNTEGYEKNIEQYSIDCVQKQSLRTNEIEKTQKMNEEIETESALIQKQNQQTRDIQKYQISSSLKSPLIGMITGNNNESSLNKFNFDEKPIQKDDICIINNKDNLNNNKKTISENINSNNVSHQNFIEKQIKNSKFNLIIDQPMQKNLQTEIKNIDKDCVPKMIEENDKSIYINQEDHNETNLEFQENNRQCTKTSMEIDNKQSETHIHSKSYKTRKQKSRESEKKTISDKVLRSSNITDLVMEGLMFTIRQDQDSVAVIEQKTKLEIDEVLENSEKVETKAGEKCLLNSSLLRLENLVTMIDSPRIKDEEHKNHHAIGNSANLSPFNVFPNDVYNNVNINEVATEMNESNVSNYDRHNKTKHLNLYQSWQHQRVSSKISNSCSASVISIENRERLMEWQGSDDEQNKNYKNNTEIKKQEYYSWDNIPEISLSKKINAGLQNTASLINRNIEEIDKYDKSMEEQYSSSLSNYSLNSSKMSTISEDSNSIELSRREANAPRIVSNESITIEQMSPALQNVLRHRCRAHRFSSTTSSEMFQQNEQKMQSMALTEDIISEMDILEDKCTDSNIVNITINSEKINNNGKSCAMINKNASEMNRNTHVKNSKGKNGTHRTLRSSSSKHASPRKLQDITEEFYYDLMHVHNKDNAIRKRCLRQKQKSLNNLDGIKSGKIRIQMLKFIQDITEGARVVVKRLNIDNKSNLLEKNSNLI